MAAKKNSSKENKPQSACQPQRLTRAQLNYQQSSHHETGICHNFKGYWQILFVNPVGELQMSAACSHFTDPCVHCGFCLPNCASYRALGTEMDSPRGRIHALKAIDAGEQQLDAVTASHFDSCLGCFACVTACPSGVRYDALLEATRPKLNAPELRSPAQRAFRRLLFSLLPYPQRLRTALAPLRGYTGGALQRLARRSGLTGLLGPQLQALEQLPPPLSPRALRTAGRCWCPPKAHAGPGWAWCWGACNGCLIRG